jgi:hypothetical protein
MLLAKACEIRLKAMLRKSTIFPFLILFILVAGFSSSAHAFSASFYVEPGENVSRSVDLSLDDRVFIQFSLVWAAEANTIHFWLVSPNGDINDFGEKGAVSLNFVCTEKGRYTMHFVNESPTTQLVTLECKIDRYVFGMPTDIFWLAFIALVVVLGAVTFVVLSKTW